MSVVVRRRKSVDVEFEKLLGQYLIGRIHHFFHKLDNLTISSSALEILSQAVIGVQRDAIKYIVKQLQNDQSDFSKSIQQNTSEKKQISLVKKVVTSFFSHPRTGGSNLQLPIIPTFSSLVIDEMNTVKSRQIASSTIVYFEKNLQRLLGDVVDIWLIMELAVVTDKDNKNVAHISRTSAKHAADVFVTRFGK